MIGINITELAEKLKKLYDRPLRKPGRILLKKMTRSRKVQKDVKTTITPSTYPKIHVPSASITPEYKTWSNMKARCYNPKTSRYENYGGRGITVCDRWRKNFTAFLNDMGEKPTPEHTIDRINPYGNYEPSNCRWATWAEQYENTRAGYDYRMSKKESI